MYLTTDSRNDPPIACDMSGAPDTPAERLAEYQRLFAQSLTGQERTSTGIRIRFAADPGVDARVRDLADLERACCPFLTSSITAAGQEIWWDITTVDDPAAKQILDAFYQLATVSSQHQPGA